MNRRFLFPILLLIACIGVVGFFAQRRELKGLREEKSRISTHISQLEEHPTEASHMTMPSTAPSSELLALRSRVTQLTQRKNQLAGIRADNEALHTQLAARGTNATASLPPGYIRRTQAQWVGMNTPESTIQSFLWAVQNRDLTKVVQVLTPRSAEQLLRDIGNSPDKFFQDVSAIPGLRIVSQQQEGTIITAQVEFLPGQVLPDAFHFQLIDGQWKMETPR